MNNSRIIVSCLTTLSLLGFTLEARVGIVVNKDLYPDVSDAIDVYINDVNTIEQKEVWLNATTFTETNTIEQLRDSLIAQYENNSLEGVVFIGDLPIAEYEIEDDYDSFGYARFATDYYYMDLNGTMQDNVRSGWGEADVFDAWTGNREPEIWLSRITPGALSGIGTEEEIINTYFERVHARMTGADTMERNYLILGNDEEWSRLESENIGDLDYPTSAITTYKRPNDTRDNWAQEIQSGYEYALIYEHSGPTTHYTSGGNFSSRTYLDLSPESNVRFYNLYACSNARYTQNNLGGLYAFSHNGLMTVGSTKTGSMLSFRYYNEPLGEGTSFGEAFQNWVEERGIADPDWHYGMTLQGVGTLKLQPYDAVTESNPISTAVAHGYTIRTDGSHILFHVPAHAHCMPLTVTLFDITGKIIHTLAKGPIAAGQHTISIDKQGIVSPRIYLCRMQAEGFTETISVVVRK